MAPHESPQRTAGKHHTNVRDYVAGLLAAIRTHQRLTGGATLLVEVQEDDKIPLPQKILLR